jgi:hypothetical protein
MITETADLMDEDFARSKAKLGDLRAAKEHAQKLQRARQQRRMDSAERQIKQWHQDLSSIKTHLPAPQKQREKLNSNAVEVEPATSFDGFESNAVVENISLGSTQLLKEVDDSELGGSINTDVNTEDAQPEASDSFHLGCGSNEQDASVDLEVAIVESAS